MRHFRRRDPFSRRAMSRARSGFPATDYLHRGSPDIGGYAYQLIYGLDRPSMRHRRGTADFPGYEEPGRLSRGGFEPTPHFRPYAAPYYYPVTSPDMNPNYDRGYLEDFDYDVEGRGWFDRASDEIASWFGDERAEMRRDLDHFFDNNRGKGPKGFVRTDVRILEDISEQLADDYYVDASDIELEVQAGEVSMRGTVPSLSAKRRAEDIALSVYGVQNVDDRLTVDPNFISKDPSGEEPKKARAARA
jgi:hypothetical protein